MVRLQQDLVAMLRATGSVEGAEQFGVELSSISGSGRRLHTTASPCRRGKYALLKLPSQSATLAR